MATDVRSSAKFIYFVYKQAQYRVKDENRVSIIKTRTF